MANPSWTDYVGVVTGLVGMMTGISGAVMGYLGYRRSNQIKALDLRLALRKDLGEARESITTLRQLMADAEASRKATLAARGLGRSGAMVVWEQTLETDRAEVTKISAAILLEGTNFAAMSEKQLESEIIAAHKIKTGLSTLVEKYRGELATDADSRQQIGQQATAMAAARMSQSAQRNSPG
ncbi:hypothetical protein QZM25_32185 [Burkholderia contaminans]|jgi:hypothetical protein|nr:MULTISPECIES: hypothetical protein [Burkholderiaceae]MBX3905260.1 hypothetical protein [Ralstonia insidiosa]MDN7577273.1 hypothetical protein [Burkholderia contaminans]NPT52259.1 hypothetical protein [Ralstonia sp. 3N]